MTKLTLTLIAATLCAASPTAPRLIDIALPVPDLPQVDSYRWQGDNLYLLPVYGDCNVDNAHACVAYSYLAVHLVFQRARQVLTVADLLAITYSGELALFHGSPISIEALARSALDRQSGACRWIGYRYDCQYSHVIDYLYTLQHWRDSVVQEGALIRVNVARLYGNYRTWLPIADTVQDNEREWRTGQGAGVPSSWGNRVGDSPPHGALAWVVVHRLADGRWQVGGDAGGDVVCSSVAFITDTRGRLDNDELGTC